MMNQENELVVYQAESGAIELRTDLSEETVWLTQKQLSEVFSVDVKTKGGQVLHFASSG